MKLTDQRLLLAVLGCLSLPCLLASAQATDRDQNLSACKNGWGSCDRSVLTQAEAIEVAATEHRRNLSDCRNGWESCDHSKLTRAEASAYRQPDSAPYGSYAQTCQKISTRGSTLKAKCQTSNGRWHSTSLQNFDRCNGGIVNDNGNLRCGTEGNRGLYHGQNDHGQNGAPGGSYTQSCQDIRTNGNTLEANCSLSNGDWKRASLQDFNLCNGEIVNDNGRLRCNR